jgi:cystathionine gamma-synthase
MPNRRRTDYTNSVVEPIFQTATYFFEDTDEVVRYHNAVASVGRYGRYDNPSWLGVERKLAELDGYDEALLFPSGMNAIITTILAFAKQGDRIIFTRLGYRNIAGFCTQVLAKMGVRAVALSQADSDAYDRAFDQAYTPDTKIVLVEAPSNPHLYLVDLERLRERISPSTLLVVDSTFSTPINFQPKQFGADLVIHSCTKYIGGHADIMAGSAAGSSELIAAIRNYRNILGGIPDPHSAFLLNRSLATLRVRMSHLNDSGQRVAEYLESHPRVRRVFYSGLDSHPHAALARNYLNGHGAVVSFEIDGSREDATRFVDALRVPFMGTNFGSQHSMVEQCSVFTYYHQSPREREELGITDSLIRLSVGLEDVESLIEDMEQAFHLLSDGSASHPRPQPAGASRTDDQVSPD